MKLSKENQTKKKLELLNGNYSLPIEINICKLS